MARNIQLSILRGLFANMPALGAGELYYATDTGNIYVGPVPTKIGGSGGSGVNTAQGIVDFGQSLTSSEDTVARVTVSASWATATSKLVCSVVEGQDHTDDEIAAEQVTATIGNIVPGTSFDVVLSGQHGSSGKFLVNIQG